MLEYIGFDRSAIDMLYVKNLKDEEEAVHTGLLKWASGQAKCHQPTTWKVVIGAMEHAEMAMQDVVELKKNVCKSQASEICYEGRDSNRNGEECKVHCNY